MNPGCQLGKPVYDKLQFFNFGIFGIRSRQRSHEIHNPALCFDELGIGELERLQQAAVDSDLHIDWQAKKELELINFVIVGQLESSFIQFGGGELSRDLQEVQRCHPHAKLFE